MSVNRYFGKKTTSQINSLTGDTQGDKVWNSDKKLYEYWTGTVWTNDDCVVLPFRGDGGAPTSISEGYIVVADPDNNDQAVLADGTYYYNSSDMNQSVIGIVYRGGNHGDDIVIAIQGEYNIYCNGAVSSIGRALSLDATDGSANYIGAAASDRHVGISLETTVGAGLCKCILQPIERY